MSLILLGGFLGLLSVILYAVVETLKETGRNEERAREADKKADAARKQTEEMLKERSVDDVARDLDSDRF